MSGLFSYRAYRFFSRTLFVLVYVYQNSCSLGCTSKNGILSAKIVFRILSGWPFCLWFIPIFSIFNNIFFKCSNIVNYLFKRKSLTLGRIRFCKELRQTKKVASRTYFTRLTNFLPQLLAKLKNLRANIFELS